MTVIVWRTMEISVCDCHSLTDISISDCHCLTDNGDWVAVSTMERGQRVDGSPLRVRFCARPEGSPGSNSVQTEKTSPLDETLN